MLVVKDWDYFNKVCSWANQHGMGEELWKELWYLHGYADREMGIEHACSRCGHLNIVGDRGVMAGRTKCELHKDFAPASFSFAMFRQTDGFWDFWFSGGVIYYGDQRGWQLEDGKVIGQDACTVDPLSVTLTEQIGWSIHT